MLPHLLSLLRGPLFAGSKGSSTRMVFTIIRQCEGGHLCSLARCTCHLEDFARSEGHHRQRGSQTLSGRQWRSPTRKVPRGPSNATWHGHAGSTKVKLRLMDVTAQKRCFLLHHRGRFDWTFRILAIKIAEGLRPRTEPSAMTSCWRSSGSARRALPAAKSRPFISTNL